MNTINVTINNKDMELEAGTTASQLIKQRGMRKAAVWINGRQLLLTEYETCEIKEGDTIRLLRIMAGG
ncbi:MAG: sulfur carrier protein ThiS [Firmicutes bacterium]|nr:sulfur carrier protein ThiS [Bacillota bacterium]